MGFVNLQRVVKASPEKLHRVFLYPDALSKWLPPYGFTCKVFHFLDIFWWFLWDRI